MRTNLNLTLWLIRHGQTNRNISDFVGQDPDEPLNETGKHQAKLLGERLRKEVVFDTVCVSSYLRAHQTFTIAEPKINGATNINIADLREIDQGSASGKLRTDLFQSPEDWERMKRNGMGFSFPGGETQYDVEHRAWSFLEREIFNNTHTRTDKHLNIAVFTHGLTLKCLLHKITGCDHSITGRIVIDNTSISKVSLKKGYWYIDSVNDVAHFLGKEIDE